MSKQAPETKKVFIGVLGKPKGLKGEIRLHLYNPDTQLIQKDLAFYIEGEDKTFLVESLKPYQKSHLVQIQNHADINLVEKYKGRKVFVMRDQLEPLKEDEFYHVDLVGCTALDENGNTIGVIKEVLVTGANDVLSIEDENQKETLIPFVEEFVLHVDMDNQTIQVVIPEVV